MKLTFSLSDPAQKRKALLIPVLVLGLAWSLSQGKVDPAKQRSSRAKAERPASENRAIPPRAKAWTAMTLDEITALNPFPIPAPTQAPEAANILESETPQEPPAATEAEPARPTIWELQSVSIVYRGPKGPLAVIGDRTVGIGDMLDENTCVVDIRDDGVWLERIADKPSINLPDSPIFPVPPSPAPDM
jgi:hypothetical protein